MNHNLQKPECINLLRKYLHKHIISLFGDLLCTGWRVYYADSNERKIKICKHVLYYNYRIYCKSSGKFVGNLHEKWCFPIAQLVVCSFMWSRQNLLSHNTGTSSASSCTAALEDGAKHLWVCPSEQSRCATPGESGWSPTPDS